MELNNIENSHEHATTSLKVVLLVFALVLVGTLAYLVSAQNRSTDSTDYSVPAITKKSTKKQSDNLVTCGETDKYGFELTLDKTTWKNYKITEVKSDSAVITCHFTMPTTSTETVWTAEGTDHAAGYASVFAVSVYTPTQWTTALTEANPPTELDHNTEYYWAWAPAQSLPEDLQTSKIADEVAKVVATFIIAK